MLSFLFEYKMWMLGVVFQEIPRNKHTARPDAWSQNIASDAPRGEEVGQEFPQMRARSFRKRVRRGKNFGV